MNWMKFFADSWWVLLVLVVFSVLWFGPMQDQNPEVRCHQRDMDAWDNETWLWRNGSCERVELEWTLPELGYFFFVTLGFASVLLFVAFWFKGMDRDGD